MSSPNMLYLWNNCLMHCGISEMCFFALGQLEHWGNLQRYAKSRPIAKREPFVNMLWCKFTVNTSVMLDDNVVISGLLDRVIKQMPPNYDLWSLIMMLSVCKGVIDLIIKLRHKQRPVAGGFCSQRDSDMDRVVKLWRNHHSRNALRWRHNGRDII